MTKKPYKIWAHPKAFEISETSPDNGWTMINEFDSPERAMEHVKILAEDMKNWHKAKSYRVEKTELVIPQINVGRDPYIKPYVNPLKGFKDV